MLEQGHRIIDFIPYIGGILRKDDKETPPITKAIERLILPFVIVLMGMYVTGKANTDDIITLKAERLQDIQQFHSDQQVMRDELDKRIDSIQTMLAIDLSKRK